jgi:hypothetical protein
MATIRYKMGHFGPQSGGWNMSVTSNTVQEKNKPL